MTDYEMRDQLAMKAMEKMIGADRYAKHGMYDIADDAYELAEAMIVVRRVGPARHQPAAPQRQTTISGPGM